MNETILAGIHVIEHDDPATIEAWNPTGRIRFKWSTAIVWGTDPAHPVPQYEARNGIGRTRWFDFDIVPYDTPDEEF